MRTNCVLCQSRPPIQNSHVVPKFVVKRLKAGNPIKTLLHSNDNRGIHQDGLKSDLLCAECEKIFRVWEDWMCKKIYDPFLKTDFVNVHYDEKLGLFAASLAFRFVQHSIDINPHKQPDENLKQIFENLRVSLLNESFRDISSYLYFHFFKPVVESEKFPPGVNTYFFESIDGRCFDYFIPPSWTWMVYVKLPGMFFILSGIDLEIIYSPSSAVGSHRIEAQGILNSSAQSGVLMDLVYREIVNRSNEIQDHYSKMSAERIAKNTAKIAALPDKGNYRAHNSYTLDQGLLAKWTESKKT